MSKHVHSWHHAPDWDNADDRARGVTAIECTPCRTFRFVAARCLWTPCVATWEHYHGGFPGALDHPDYDPEVNGPAPIPFVGPDPDPTAVRDYNGAAL